MSDASNSSLNIQLEEVNTPDELIASRWLYGLKLLQDVLEVIVVIWIPHCSSVMMCEILYQDAVGDLHSTCMFVVVFKISLDLLD